MKEVKIGDKKVSLSGTVDAVGLFCPLPLVKLKLELEQIGLNEVVEILADDEGILEDLPNWCKETGNKLLYIKKNEENIFVAYVEKSSLSREKMI